MQNYITVWISSQVRRVSSVVLVMLAFSAFGGESAQQSVVEIAAVDICNCFHGRFIKERGPQALRPKTPFRVGRALRLDKNLLTGSVSIVSNFRLPSDSGEVLIRRCHSDNLVGVNIH